MPSPDDVVRTARPGKSVVGWKLDPAQRAELLDRIAPHYDNVVADHVTLRPRVDAQTPLPDEVAAEIVGSIDDDRGVHALVVAIDGGTDRPGGGTYHITWSLRPNRRPRESNDALASMPWQPLGEPIPLNLKPAMF